MRPKSSNLLLLLLHCEGGTLNPKLHDGLNVKLTHESHACIADLVNIKACMMERTACMISLDFPL